MDDLVAPRDDEPSAWLYSQAGMWLMITLCAMVVTGCIPGGKRTNIEYQYTLDYKTPAFPELPRLDAVLTVNRFSSVEAYSGLSIIYSPSPFKRDVYNYDHWMIAPGAMVSDYLLRDFRSAGLFRAVLSPSEYEGTRYLLQGEVEKFIEVDEDGTSKAELSVSVTLLDTMQADVTGRIIFQKSYASSAPVKERTPSGVAAGMSKAMEKLSAEVIRDVYQAVSGKK